VSAVAFALERPDREELERWWTGLEQRADCTAFLAWAWIGTWIDVAGMPDQVLVGRAGGEIVCLGLLRRNVERRHRFVRSRTLFLHQSGKPDEDIIFIEYNGFLTDRRHGNLLAEATAFVGENGKVDEVDLGGITAADFERLAQGGIRTLVTARKTSAYVDLKQLRDGGGDYLASISSNTRYQIRRALKAYEVRGPLSLLVAGTVAEALTFFDALGVLHEAGWQRRGAFGAWRYPFLVRFHRRLIERSFEAGGMEIVRIACGEEAIGYIYCVNHGGWSGSYLSGFAYEEDNKIKPGLVSHYLHIEHKLATGGDILDFLAGDHRYKTSLGVAGAEMLWVKAQQQRPALLLERGLRSLKQRVEQRRAAKAAPKS
jgi:CelD/BcsL family acetyltransferase involved in cellulose biosynthesis